jgi:hypothetical protein
MGVGVGPGVFVGTGDGVTVGCGVAAGTADASGFAVADGWLVAVGSSDVPDEHDAIIARRVTAAMKIVADRKEDFT